MTLVKIGTGSRILPPEGPFRISLSGHISVPDHDIFTKFGGYAGNELPRGVEWNKHVSFEKPIWQTAAMYHTYSTTYRKSILTSSTRSHFFTL